MGAGGKMQLERINWFRATTVTNDLFNVVVDMEKCRAALHDAQNLLVEVVIPDVFN